MAYKDKAKQAVQHKAYYEKNKERIWSYAARKASIMKYKKANPEKIKMFAKEWYLDTKEVRLQKSKEWREKNAEYVKAKDHAKTAALTDAYMKKHLIKMGYSRTHIRKYPELIETHRMIIKTKRL